MLLAHCPLSSLFYATEQMKGNGDGKTIGERIGGRKGVSET